MSFDVDRGGHVAVSYARGDRDEAQRLVMALKRYRTPPELLERQTEFGFAPSRLAASLLPHLQSSEDVDLPPAVKIALREADHLVVLCSRMAVEDRWIDEETRTFLAHRRTDNQEGRLHAVILPGDPEKKLPAAVAEAGVEAVADLSIDKDGWEVGLRKLRAALYGVTLDTIKALEKERAKKRQRSLVFAMIGVLAIFAGGAGAAIALGYL